MTIPGRVWDCAIVGGGFAGLSAAVYMGRFERSTVVFDDGCGRWTYGQRNENYLGFPSGVSARRLQQLGQEQARRFGVVVRNESVTQVSREEDGRFRVATARGVESARTLIWATGVLDRWPGFPRARSLVGKGLFWCIVCDGYRTREKKVLLIGEDDHAASTALQFLTYTPHLTFLAVPGRSRLSARAERRLVEQRIAVLRDRIADFDAPKGKLLSVTLERSGPQRADFLFSLLGSAPRTELLRGIDVPLGRSGHVRIDEKNRTEAPGIFAAGDVTNRHSHQVASAVHEGSMAAQAANQFLYGPAQRL